MVSTVLRNIPMTISRTINKPHHPDIFMNDTPIAKVPNHKHLGNSGCRIDPWGTPALMKPQSDDTQLITTLCFLPDR
jgi:hypothetical protein